MTWSGATRSVWMDAVPEEALNPLRTEVTADVCVVGGGIAGVSAAYLLTAAGKRVVLLDDNRLGGGETGRTTAHLSSALDDRFYMIEQWRGADVARLAAESHSAAIDRIARIVEELGIDCNYRYVDGYLFDVTDDTSALEREKEAALRAGLSVEMTDRPPYDPFGSGRALRFGRQATFHPLRFLRGVAAAITRAQSEIYTGTFVTGVEEADDGVVITTSAGVKVRAAACVVATNSSIVDLVTTHAKQAPYRTYAVALHVPDGALPDALYWDNGDPYKYIRLAQTGAGRTVVVVGGEDHKTGQEDDGDARLDRLEAWTRAKFPFAEDIVYAWSGQVMEPADGLGFNGRAPGARNVYMISGDSGHGMTNSVLGAMLVSDLILGQPNGWVDVYAPERVPARAAKDLIKENLNVAKMYVKDRVSDDPASAAATLAPGQGTVINRNGEHVAVCLDKFGVRHEKSAICPHLKCIVHWNTLEQSWDCPCHGSRFEPDGTVLNGPAASPLSEAGGA